MFFPRMLSNLVKRGVPVFFAITLYFVIISTCEGIFVYSFFPMGQLILAVLWHMITAMAVILVATVVSMLALEHEIKDSLSPNAKTVPYWPSNPFAPANAVSEKRFDVTGTIQRVTALNQYILVKTDIEEKELRMSLTEAVKLLPPETGARIHRSIWLNYDQIKEVRFVDGNPKVVDMSGDLVSVSRKMTPQIQKILLKRSKVV